MPTATTLRWLRMKHHISSAELGNSAGISDSRIYQIEEGNCSRVVQEKKLADALEALIYCREEALRQLKADYVRFRGQLLTKREKEEVLSDGI